ncbi:MAG TPA: T9SS type A sorting domain-containing protein, partial [Rubricoccaceae bacterium]
VVRITRYGRPHPRINPRIETPRSGGRAQLYVDYTMSEAPPNLSFPGSTALADTLQTLDIVLTPVDDGVDEPTEAVVLFVYCSDGTGLFGPIQSGCTTAPGPGFFSLDMTLLSNGAGSGLAIGTSRPERIGGTGIVTFTLNGQGFTPDMTATLSGPGSFTADTVAVVRAGVQAEARFAFEGAPAGSYTLTLTGPGGTSTLPNAVTIDATIEAGSSDVWALLQSNPFRPGLSATQRIEYGNDGATDAYMVPIRITIPADAEVEFLGEMLDYGLGVTTSQDSLWQLQTIRRPDIRGTLGTGRRGGGDPNMIEQQVAVFYIPFVPAGGTGTLAFQMINSGDSYWTVEVGTPWSDLDLDTLVDDPAMLAADPALAAFAAADCGVGGRMFEDAGRAEACFKCIGAIASAVAGVFPAANCAKAAIETGMNTGLALAHAVHGDQSDAIVSGVDAATGLLEVAVNCANVLFPPANLLHGGLLVYNLFTRVKSGAGAFSGAVDCLKCAGWEEPIWDVLEVFRAADPNEKYGPAGIGDARYVSDFGRVPYEIGFENLATASASAVEIVVTDTLDVDRLDLSTFAFGPVVLPDTTLRPPAGVQSWTTFWDRRPERQSIVRADMHLDRTTGVVRWQMSDLDPETYALQADSLDGFLPPNDGTGRGQGRVSFLVRAVDDLPDGTTLSNRATIRFDREDLIQTNTFSNTLDLGAPTSRVRAVASAGTDSTWAVSWSGTDTAAGVGSYDLYVQADGGPFELWAVTSDTTAVFTGAPGPVYGFFSLAHDWVGNVEPPKTEAEAATVPVVAGEGPSNLPAELTLALPYPNPVRGALVVPFGLPAAELVRVKVFDMQGRVVAVLADEEHAAGWHALRWDADVAAGVYVVRLEAGGVARMRRLTVVR